MGGGRRTYTVDYDYRTDEYKAFDELQRDLQHDLSGVIFGCTNYTYDECIKGKIFGLPRAHLTYVCYIKPGLPIFLFNYSTRILHGVFVATSHGQLEINPHGWTGTSNVKTAYPAQVRVEAFKKCNPLKETEFKSILIGNYTSDRIFRFELDARQVEALCNKFKSDIPSPNLIAKKFSINTSKKPSVIISPKIEIKKQPIENSNISNKSVEFNSGITRKNVAIKGKELSQDIGFSFKNALLATSKALSTPINKSLSPAPVKRRPISRWVSKKVESKSMELAKKTKKDGVSMPQLSLVNRTSLGNQKIVTNSNQKNALITNKNTDTSSNPSNTSSNISSNTSNPPNNNKDENTNSKSDSMNLSKTRSFGWNIGKHSMESTFDTSENIDIGKNINLAEDKKRTKKRFKQLKKGCKGWDDPSISMMDLNAETMDWYVWHEKSIQELSDKSLLKMNEIESFAKFNNNNNESLKDEIKKDEYEIKKEDIDIVNESGLKKEKTDFMKENFRDENISMTANTKNIKKIEKKVLPQVKNLEIEDVIKKTDVLMSNLSFMNKSKEEEEVLIGSPMSISTYDYESPREVVTGEDLRYYENQKNIFRNEKIKNEDFVMEETTEMNVKNEEDCSIFDAEHMFQILSSMPFNHSEIIHVFGGINKETVFDKVETFNPRTYEWCGSYYLPVDTFVFGNAVSLYNSRFIMGGGHVINQYNSYLYCLKPGSNFWTKLQNMNNGRSDFAATQVDDKICVAGGLTEQTCKQNSVEFYDAEKDIWIPGPDMKTDRYAFSATSNDKIIYACGGQNKVNGTLDTCEFLDIREKNWHYLTQMPHKSQHLCVEMFQGNIWTLGGCDGKCALNNVISLDIRTQKWQLGPNMNVPHLAGTSAVVDGDLFIIGGLNDVRGGSLAGMERYDLIEGKWILVKKNGFDDGHNKQLRVFHASCMTFG